MIFRFLFCFSLIFAGSALASPQYEMMPGSYSFVINVNGIDESYPVKIKFAVADFGKLTNGSIEYPTYDCRAKVAESQMESLDLTLVEEMELGFDTCIASRFLLSINSNSLFSPESKDYLSVFTFEEGKKLDADIEKYHFTSTPFSRLRIRGKYRSIDDMLKTTDSSILEKSIKVLHDARVLQQAKQALILLNLQENEKFEEIRRSSMIRNFEDYMATYPGSAHNKEAKLSIARIKKEIKIAELRKEGSPLSLYQAYLLSAENTDVRNLLFQLKTLPEILQFVEDKPKLSSHNLVKTKQIALYKKQDDFEGYIRAHHLSADKADLVSAYNSIVCHSGEPAVNPDLLDYFYSRFVTSIGKVPEFLLLLNKLKNTDADLYYKKLMASKWFGAHLTLDNFFNSVEYKEVLSKFRPRPMLVEAKKEVAYQLKYPERTFQFMFDAECTFSHTDSRKGGLGMLESMFSSALGSIYYYDIKKCIPRKSDLETIRGFEQKLLGSSKVYNEQWEVSEYSHREKIYPENYSGGSPDYVMVEISCIAAICITEHFKLSGGPGSVMDPGGTSSTSIHDVGQGIAGNYSYSVKLTPVNRICTGSVNISGTKPNVTIGVYESCRQDQLHEF